MFPFLLNVCRGVMKTGKHVCRTPYIMKRKLHAESQNHRGLVQVQGAEASSFLQGLITNDVKHLETGNPSMFSMMLNTKGRILYDLIVYKKQDDVYLIECDKSEVQKLIRHLKIYRVRRKITLDSVDNEYNVWSVFDSSISMGDTAPMDMDSLYMNPKSESSIDMPLAATLGNDMLVTRDPRLRYLGHRLIIPVNSSIKDIVPSVKISKGLFINLRYRLGICEGIFEIPPTKCFPLEANCDYMHGVSFHKGCYIGQELTARTFHTGVIRKRYMPISFPVDASHLPFDAEIVNEKNKVVGKVRGINGCCGIGLLRIAECLSAETLLTDNLSIKALRPSWWPYEASKFHFKGSVQ